MDGRLTVENLKDSRIPAALGICRDDSRFFPWLNEAESRLLAYGRWWGSIQEVNFCVRDCLLTWPREVATIEAMSLGCAGPLTIGNAWYSYQQTIASCCGSGVTGCGSSPLLGWGNGLCAPANMQTLARKPCSFATTHKAGLKLRFYPQSSTDVGKVITVQGRDSNGVWVRKSYSGTVIDGERVTLALPYVDTTTLWAAGEPTAIQKPITNYRVLLYSFNPDTSAEIALGNYQPGETNPLYRVSKVHGLSRQCCDDDESESEDCCQLTNIRALVKLAHIQLVSDSDWVLFQNIAAYKEAMLAVRDWENGDLAGGNLHFYGSAQPKQARMSGQATLRQMGAIPLLAAELRSMTGDVTEIETHYEADNRLAWELAGFR